MNILLIGSGGREHALAWKIAQSPRCSTLYIAPGNAGTMLNGTNVPLKVNDFEAIGRFCLEKNVKIVVVGPEEPLVNGIHDYFLGQLSLSEVSVIGPPREGAMLEGSKDFAKQFMMRHGIPTAAYRSFTTETLEEGKVFLRSLTPPFVLKADGLAAGKGVLIIPSLAEAEAQLQEMLEGKFGKASHTVVIEQFLQGIECSAFAITDGNTYRILPEAKDYKCIGEGNTGPNTGGMGAVSPVPFADKVFLTKVEQRIIRPTIEGLKDDHIPYKGFLFFGLMNVHGDPYIIEYNVRLGDPETEATIPRLQNDLVEMFEAVASGRLDTIETRFDERTVTTVMLVSGGYPGDYTKGYEINGLGDVSGSITFHAGTRKEGDKVLTNGGRVLAISSYGRTMKEALEKSYQNAKHIRFTNVYYRNDIGFDLE